MTRRSEESKPEHSVLFRVGMTFTRKDLETFLIGVPEDAKLTVAMGSNQIDPYQTGYTFRAVWS